MKITDKPPDQLTERELFTEFVEVLDRPDGVAEGYDEARLRARRADLLAEIGERLEALEAARALISGTEAEPARGDDRPHERDGLQNR